MDNYRKLFGLNFKVEKAETKKAAQTNMSQVPPAKPGACICEPLKAAESWAA